MGEQNGQSSNDEHLDREKYQNISEQLEKTHQKELSAHESLTQKAIDLVKVNLLSLSIIATGLSTTKKEVEFSLLLLGGVVSFLYAMWASVHVFDPTRYPRGIDYEGGIQMDKQISQGLSGQEYYREILYSYINATEDFDDKFYFERRYFTKSVWSTLVGITLLVFSALNIFYLKFPVWVEYPFLFVVPILGVWGRAKSSEV